MCNCSVEIGNVLPNWKWNITLNGARHLQRALLHYPRHQYTHMHTPSQWDQQKGIFDESGGGLMRRGLAGGWLSLHACVCVLVRVCMCVSAVLATWVSAELRLGRGGWWVCLGGTRAAAGQTEPEDDWADGHVRQVCIEEPSQGNDRSDSLSMQNREQIGDIWQLGLVEVWLATCSKSCPRSFA